MSSLLNTVPWIITFVVTLLAMRERNKAWRHVSELDQGYGLFLTEINEFERLMAYLRAHRELWPSARFFRITFDDGEETALSGRLVVGTEEFVFHTPPVANAAKDMMDLFTGPSRN
jgi:hypothetical protein